MRPRPKMMPASQLGLSLVLGAHIAFGQESAEALAEVLYRQGRALMAEGNAREACPKFAESYRLDAATGTLLNLAWCHETEGKLASAWLEFSRAAIAARRDRRPDRVQFAQDHLATIEPNVAHITVTVPPEGDVPGLAVRVDGVPVGDEARGVSTPVDPGDHTVEATAPGHKPRLQHVIIENATNADVVVHALEPVAPSTAPVASMPPPPAPVPTSVYVAGGVTLALAAAAGVTAFVYMDHRARDGVEQREPELGQNRRLGVINLVLDAGALAAAGVTVYLYATRRSDSSGPPGIRKTAGEQLLLEPWVGPRSGGFGLSGRF